MTISQHKFNKEEIVAAECRHVVYIPPMGNDKRDFHLSKEILHIKKDGEIKQVPNLRIFVNYPRKFWITKPIHRKYEQKKEWEDADKLQMFTTTESQLLTRASRALGMMQPPHSMRQLAKNPNLYGCDVESTALVKHEMYRQKFPNTFTPASIAASDVETSMITDRIIMQTISYKDRVYTAVMRDFVKGVGKDDNEIKKVLQAALIKYLGQDYEIKDKDGNHLKDKDGNLRYGNILKDRKVKWEIDLVADDGVVVWNVLRKAHKWQPDILTFWNMSFDIKKMNASLDFHKINKANAWSDPFVPEPLRYFDFVEGKPQKITASKKVTPIPPQARWHKVFTPASFSVLDAMCCYKQVRTGKPEERSYGLDAILAKHLDRGKLKFKEADGLAKADWHVFMQKNYPVEYIIYNVFDCIGIEMLDEKTQDLSVSVPSGAAMSDYKFFASQPRRVCDKLHYFVLERGRVMGTTSDEMATEMDKYTVSLRNWIKIHNFVN